ncbi:unnamed protein product [Rotaria magnacalcarata]|uniref:J domain-containing protein n=5 Tax=Rotaria magnacalcarata TaxID=392030 RepID=A0A815ZBB1_9BILA|nr:unnamed protein product [Rotaria magnacalcarata]CAF2087910.1 unnamed protein product [Rotaria magnacalcarata]
MLSQLIQAVPSKTPYKILEVPENINFVALRGCYRRIIHQYKQNQISAEEFRLKVRAYETLSDYDKRKKYDSSKEWISDLPLSQYTTQQLAAEPVLISTLIDRLDHASITEINAQDPITGQTILYVAARAGNVVAVQYLIDQEAKPELSQRTKSTALHVASFYGHADVVRCLLESGVDYRILNVGGQTAEDEAANDDVKQMFSELKQTPYVRAAVNDIDWFLNNSLIQHIDEEYYGQRQTLLHCASKKGHFDLVSLLVEKLSANLNIVDVNGNSALHLACYGGHIAIVDYLINKGCNSTFYNRWGLTAEQEGSKHGDKIMNIFRSIRGQNMFERARQGIDWWFEYYFGTQSPDTIDSEGISVLHHACCHGQYNIAKWLLEHQANINIQTRKTPKNTPLHGAKYHGHLNIVELLLEYGADITIQNDLNLTIFEQGFSKEINLDRARLIHRLLVAYQSNLSANKLIDVHIYLEDNQDDDPNLKIQLHHATTYDDLLYVLSTKFLNNEQSHFSIAGRSLNFQTKETTLLSAVCRARYRDSKLIDTPLCLVLHKEPYAEKTSNECNIHQDPEFDFHVFNKYFQSVGIVTHFQLKPSTDEQTINVDDLTFTFSGGSIKNDLEFEVRAIFSPVHEIFRSSECICLFETSLYEDTSKLLKLPLVSMANAAYARLYTLAISTPYWFSCNTRRARLPMLNGIHAFIQHINIIPMLLTLPVDDMVIGVSINQPLISREKPVQCTCLSLQKHDPINFPEIAYHGTNISFVQSIIADGLVVPTTVVSAGKCITRRENHIRRGREASSIADFVDAIFLSPSVHYSCDPTYAVAFEYGDQQLLPVLECSVRKNSYSCFPCTVPSYTPHPDDNMQTIEWRMLDSENIVINAVLFIPKIDSLEVTKRERINKLTT